MEKIFLFTIKDYKDTRESFYNELKSIKDYFYNLDSNYIMIISLLILMEILK